MLKSLADYVAVFLTKSQITTVLTSAYELQQYNTSYQQQQIFGAWSAGLNTYTKLKR